MTWRLGTSFPWNTTAWLTRQAIKECIELERPFSWVRFPFNLNR